MRSNKPGILPLTQNPIDLTQCLRYSSNLCHIFLRANALTPYPQQEFASKEIAPSEYQATFVVVNPATPLVAPTPQ